MHNREGKWINKTQLRRYASLRFVAGEHIWNSYCLVTIVIYIPKVGFNIEQFYIFPFKFTSWPTESFDNYVIQSKE